MLIVNNSTEIAFIVSSAFSAFCAVCVLLTFVVFPVMRTRYFMDIIIWISFSDLLAAVVSAFGFPSNTSPLCPIQAALNVFFFKASWMWSTMLAHQLFSIATKRNLGFSPKQRHIICWSVPLVTTLLPLTTNSFGRSDDGIPIGWCFLEGSEEGYEIWFPIAFMLPLFVCVVIMLIYAIKTFQLYQTLGENRLELQATIAAIILYPLAMILCWVPNLVYVILQISNLVGSSTTISYVGNVLSILASQNGTLTAVIFFMKSKESQYRWSQLLCCAKESKITTSIDSGSGTLQPVVVDPDEFFSDASWLREPRALEQGSRISEIMNTGFHESHESSRSPLSGSVTSNSTSVASSPPISGSSAKSIPIPISFLRTRETSTVSDRPLSSVTNSVRSDPNFATLIGSHDSSVGWERYPSRDIQMSSTPLVGSSISSQASTQAHIADYKRKKSSITTEDVILEEDV